MFDTLTPSFNEMMRDTKPLGLVNGIDSLLLLLWIKFPNDAPNLIYYTRSAILF